MKIGILSRHSVANYGSLCQAYALQKSIENLGHDAVNINYTPDNEYGGRLANTLLKVSRWNKFKIILIPYYFYQKFSCSYSFNKFKLFRYNLLKETEELNKSTVKNCIKDFDLFCTGSDQVWNVLYDNKMDFTYLFDFLPKEYTRFSYASSFGGNSLLEGKDCIKKYLKNYSSITVREDSGVNILKDLNISGKQVLDPTLLLKKEDWQQFINTANNSGKYILIYQLKPNKNFDEYAKKLSNQTRLKLIRVSTMLFQFTKCGQFKYLPNISEFLSLIANATCLITDSFHGTCFAINLNVPFIEILPNRFNERNQSLLRMFNLEDRVLSNYEDTELINKEINWNNVNKILEEKRKNSINELSDMILSCDKTICKSTK